MQYAIYFYKSRYLFTSNLSHASRKVLYPHSSKWGTGTPRKLRLWYSLTVYTRVVDYKQCKITQSRCDRFSVPLTRTIPMIDFYAATCASLKWIYVLHADIVTKFKVKLPIFTVRDVALGPNLANALTNIYTITQLNKNLAIANRSRVSCINANNNTMTLKSGLEVTQCHWKWCRSNAWCGLLFAFCSNNGRICSRLWWRQRMAWPWKQG